MFDGYGLNSAMVRIGCLGLLSGTSLDRQLLDRLKQRERDASRLCAHRDSKSVEPYSPLKQDPFTGAHRALVVTLFCTPIRPPPLSL